MKTEEIKLAPQWRKSKDEVWNEIFSAQEEHNTPSKVRLLSFWKYAAAAVVAMIVAGGSFSYLYTATQTVARGARLTVTLPDGSNVSLNAESQLKYKPYWWFASRDVRLTGEAYFEVKRGSHFTVKSGNKQARVLGTSFNVLARPEAYRITCLTGKVEVSVGNKTALLTPNMQATWQNNQLKVNETNNTAQYIGWMHNRFTFIGVPLFEVVKEIERQYDIRIATSSSLNYRYTGNFYKAKQPQEVLEIIGKPFGITFTIKP